MAGWLRRRLRVSPHVAKQWVQLSGVVDKHPTWLPRSCRVGHRPRRADALTDICHRVLACAGLPDNGGDRPQLTVTVHYDMLTGRLGAGGLDNGGRLTPAQVRHWINGGLTCVDNLVLLCRHHHRVIHHHWTVRLGHDRQPAFIPPEHLDPLRRPRRNTYHMRT